MIIIMISWKSTFLFLLALVAPTTFFCSASTVIPFVTIDKGEYSGIDIPLNEVYRTATEFAIFWSRHRSIAHSSSNDPAVAAAETSTIPNVDFSKEMVIAVCMGVKNSGGFHVEITSVDRGDSNNDGMDDENTLAVNFMTAAPSSTLVTMALTQPYHIIRLIVPDTSTSSSAGTRDDNDDLKIVFVGSQVEEKPSQSQPPAAVKFIITVQDDADKDAIRAEIEKLTVVTNVEVMSSLPFLFVDLDLREIEKEEAQELLRRVKGVNAIEADS